MASAIEPEWLDDLFPSLVRRDRAARFDTEKQRVTGLSIVTYLDLVLREDPTGSVDPGDASSALAEALAPRAARSSSGTRPRRDGWPVSTCSAAPCPKPAGRRSTTPLWSRC